MNHKELIKNNKDTLTVIVACVLVLNLILSVYTAFFKRDALWIEELKAGGSDNFALVQQLYNNDTYKQQQALQLSQYLDQMGAKKGETPTADTTKQENTAAGTTLSQDQINQILSSAYFQGNRDAQVILLEYSDLICPFCKRHFNDQTLEKVVAKYPKDVALAFKNMPLAQLHPTAPLGAQGVACANKLGGYEKAFAFLAEGFKADNFTTESVVAIAKQIGLNETQFSACVTSDEAKAEVEASIKEGQSVFGINGTPGNVIIDRKTGKYTIVNGAYPFEKFDEEVSKLLK